MSMTEISPDIQSHNGEEMCLKTYALNMEVLPQKEYHAHSSQDERNMCGFLSKSTNLRGNHDWWLEMQRVVIMTHTDVQNNVI
jgi:hypothetical protein